MGSKTPCPIPPQCEKWVPFPANGTFSLYKIPRKTFGKSLDKIRELCYNMQVAVKRADIAQSVEHLIGNEEVISSNLIISSISESVPIGTDSV